MWTCNIALGFDHQMVISSCPTRGAGEAPLHVIEPSFPSKTVLVDMTNVVGASVMYAASGQPFAFAFSPSDPTGSSLSTQSSRRTASGQPPKRTRCEWTVLVGTRRGLAAPDSHPAFTSGDRLARTVLVGFVT